jgi:hypothetical protein
MREQIIFRGATGQNCRFKSLPATSGLPPSTDIIRRCDWSGWCKKRKIARTANATSLSGKAASVPCKLPGKVPAGQISAFVVQPLAQKYSGFPKAQITFITGAIPSHTEGRFAIVTDVGAGCDGRDSVGRAGGRRAGLAVSDRTARGRTMLPTSLPEPAACTRRGRIFGMDGADGEVVWSWRPDAGVKSGGDASGPTGFGLYRQSARRRWQTSRSPGRARSKP